MTGRPGHRTMERNGRSTVSYLMCTPRVPFFMLILIGPEAKNLLTFQGRRGIASIVRWNPRPVIFGVEILDRIITGKYAKRINLTVIRAHYQKHLAVHRSHDTRTEIPWTKSCNELPGENSTTLNSVIFDMNITGEISQRINLVMISVTIVRGEG